MPPIPRLPNIPQSATVSRATSVHNALIEMSLCYGRLLQELSAENHALRAEIALMKDRVRGETSPAPEKTEAPEKSYSLEKPF
jgi:hypothetical protein